MQTRCAARSTARTSRTTSCTAWRAGAQGRSKAGARGGGRLRARAPTFARGAARAGVGRVVYLGGLGDQPASEHLRSRHEAGRALAEHGPPLTYFRAAMVIGAGSESYVMLRSLVERLPAMVAPAWLRTRTQPIGIDDVLAYLVKAPDVASAAGGGGPIRREDGPRLRQT